MPTNTGSDIFGVITFVVIAVVALAAIAVIVIGMRLKRQRIAGEKELIARREAAHVDAVEVDPDAPVEAASEPTAREPAKPAPVAAPAAKPTPPVAVAPVVASPAPAAASIEGDITQLKGLGPKLAATLAELGYTRLDQIAALTPDQAADLDAKLGNFQGRMARDRWIEQAKLLVVGDRAAYEAEFGKLG